MGGVVAASAITLFVGVLGAGASGESSNCRPGKGYRVDARGSESVVLYNDTDGQTVVCHRPSGRRTVLRDIEMRRWRYWFVGPFVAYVYDGVEGAGCGFAGVELVNSKAGYEMWLDERDCAQYASFIPVVVKPSGTAVWGFAHSIYACDGQCRTGRRRLAGTGQSVPARVIARGKNVRPGTLRATPHGITWRERKRIRWRRIR